MTTTLYLLNNMNKYDIHGRTIEMKYKKKTIQ